MIRYFLIIFIILFKTCALKANSWQWAKSGGSETSDHVANICTDKHGDLYVYGYFGNYYQNSPYIIFDTDTIWNNGVNQIYLVKYSSSGAMLWSKSMGTNNPNTGPNSAFEYAGEILYDSISNFIYLTGRLYGTNIFGNDTISSNAFLAKMDINGNFIWGSPINGNMGTPSLSLDSFGTIFVFGNVIGNGSFDSIIIPEGGFIAKYSGNGNCVFAKTVLGSEVYFYSIRVINSDIYAVIQAHNDTVILDTANFNSTVQSQSIFACFDSLGSIRWYRTFSTTDSYGNNAKELVVDGNYDFYIIGSFYDDITFDSLTIYTSANIDMFLVKYDLNGNAVWVRQTNGSFQSTGSAVSIFQDGFINCVGSFNGSIILDSDTVIANSNLDQFVISYNYSGDVIEYEHFGPVNYGKICNDESGNIYIAGVYTDTMEVGNTTLNLVNQSSDVYIAKHNIMNDVREELRVGNNNLLIYANPNSGKCTITVPEDFIPEKNLTLSIFDSNGRLIQRKTLDMSGDKIKVDIEQEAKGVYSVILSSTTKKYSGKIIFE